MVFSSHINQVFPPITAIQWVIRSLSNSGQWKKFELGNHVVSDMRCLYHMYSREYPDKELFQPCSKFPNDILRFAIHEQWFARLESIEFPFSFCIATIVMPHIVVSVPGSHTPIRQSAPMYTLCLPDSNDRFLVFLLKHD
jgi:hypothetical protein